MTPADSYKLLLERHETALVSEREARAALDRAEVGGASSQKRTSVEWAWKSSVKRSRAAARQIAALNAERAAVLKQIS